MDRHADSARFPWYDAPWLAQFVRAKSFIASERPQALQGFMDAMAPLRTNPQFKTRHLGSLLDGDVLARIRAAIKELQPVDLELHEIKSFGRWVVRYHPILSELQESMTGLVSEVAGETVISSYNFLSLYTRMGRCAVHMDAPFAKWTLDICVEQSDPWPIHFSQVRRWPEDTTYPQDDWESHIRKDPDNRFESITMQPGEAVVFSGSSQFHYRDPLPHATKDAFCHLMFFHFIPAGVEAYVDPSRWESFFGIPGLSTAIGNPAPASTFG